MGVKVETASGGCCGLAGSWGYEAAHHDLSLRCGEEGLLPAVRKAAPETLVVANGFSCRTQIEQAGTGRSGLHVAQVMALARSRAPGGPFPERGAATAPDAPLALRLGRAAALAAGGTLGIALTAAVGRRWTGRS
jgi:hypothetical protein